MPTTGVRRDWRFRFHWSVCGDCRAAKLALRLHNIVIQRAHFPFRSIRGRSPRQEFHTMCEPEL